MKKDKNTKRERPFKKKDKMHYHKLSHEELIEVIKKEKREKAIIVAMTAFIVLLLVGLGYGMYTFYKTKTATTEQMILLNGTIGNLTEVKVQLISDKGNLSSQVEFMNSTIKELNDQVKALVKERNTLESENKGLNSDLDSLQADYDDLKDELDTVQSDLDDCEAAAP